MYCAITGSICFFTSFTTSRNMYHNRKSTKNPILRIFGTVILTVENNIFYRVNLRSYPQKQVELHHKITFM
jgi:hypothetical protein